MNNDVSSGDVLTLAAPSGGVTSGVGVLIGALFGIAFTTADAGDLFALKRKGQFTHTAEGAGSGQAWAVGDAVYWDNTNKRLTKTSSGNTLVGIATAVKLTAATTGTFVIVPKAA